MRVTAVILLAIASFAARSADAAGDVRFSTDVITALIDAAVPGSVVHVPAGVYEGRIVIRKPIILEGGGVVVIDGGGDKTVIDILSPDVTFRGFEVRGSGKTVEGEAAGIRADTGPVVIEDNVLRDVFFGIDLRSASGSIVRRNDIEGKDLELGRRGDGIRLWWSNDCIVEDNTVRHMRDLVFWYSENLSIRRNRVSDSRYGLHFMYSHNTILERNELVDNSVGTYLMYSNGLTLRENLIARNRGTSGYGVGLKDCDGLVCERNSILANRVGIFADNVPSSIDGTAEYVGNIFAFNESGLAFTTQTDGAEVWGNGFIDNEVQVAVLGRGSLEDNFFSRDGRGNFWSDYAGFDRDGDGLGDLPYQAVSLFENLLAREPNLRLFIHSPAQRAVDFTARALPEMRPIPKFTDPAPLMRAPTMVASMNSGGSRWSMIALCAGLLAGGALLALAGGRSSGLGRLEVKTNRKVGGQHD